MGNHRHTGLKVKVVIIYMVYEVVTDDRHLILVLDDLQSANVKKTFYTNLPCTDAGTTSASKTIHIYMEIRRLQDIIKGKYKYLYIYFILFILFK